jgi:hypothetical protein
MFAAVLIHEAIGSQLTCVFVDPARQAANDALVADLRADLGDLGRAELGHRPVAGETADMAREIGDELRAVRRVDDFRVELHRIITPRVIGDHRERRAGAGRDGAEAGGERRHLVAMAHPDLMRLAFAPQAIEQLAAIVDLDEGAAEFTAVAQFHRAAELVHHHLLTVADPHDRQPAVENRLGNARAVLVEHAGRAARQDDPPRLHPRERRVGRLERGDFGIDAGFTDAARDELRHLAAEIDDEDRIAVLGHGAG